MKTLEVGKVNFDSKKIEDYVENRLNANDRADFEADMMMEVELQKEVARAILKKMLVERKVREQVEASENLRKTTQFLEKRLVVKEESHSRFGFTDWWKKLSMSLSTY